MVDVGMTWKLVENPKGSRRATGTGLGPNYAQASNLYVTANAGDEMVCDCFTPSPRQLLPANNKETMAIFYNDKAQTCGIYAEPLLFGVERKTDSVKSFKRNDN
ncbi:unnamed protein product [Eretmochelys imbricata]